MKTGWIVFAIVVGVALLAVLAMLGVYIFSPRSSAKLIAHRGHSGKQPANTADAFRAAAAIGVYGIETDIRETADGVFVCNHDADVTYADGTKIVIANATFAELNAKPILNPKTEASVFICTFTDYLDICKEGDKVAVIELKETCDEAKLGRILQLVDSHYDRKKVCFIAFDFGNLTRLRTLDNTLDLQYLSQTENDPVFAECLEQKISIDVKQTILTKKLVKQFHAAGLKVNVWTVNRKYELNVVRIKGVDYVTTDIFYEEDGKIQ